MPTKPDLRLKSKLLTRVPAKVEYMLEPSLHFNAELYVDEPPEVVWDYFTDLRQWNRWSPICRQCRLLGERIENGSTLQISFKVIGMTVVVNAELVDVMAPNLITWRGTKFGINALHTYRFAPHRAGTLMTNEEKIFGAMFPLSVLIKSWYRITNLSRKSLEGIRRGVFCSWRTDDGISKPTE